MLATTLSLLTLLLAVPASDPPGAPQERRAGLNWRSPKIELPTALPLGEPLRFERRWTRRRVQGEELMADAEHRSSVALTCDRLDEVGNRIVEWRVDRGSWVRFDQQGSGVDQAADRGLAELATDLAYELRVSPKYRTVLLEDLEAARRTADAAVERALDAIRAERFFYAEKQRAMSIVQSAVFGPDLLEYTLLLEPLVLLDTLGRAYRMGEDRRWEDWFVNPIGSAPLEAWATVEPLVHDVEGGTLLVRRALELNREATRAGLRDALLRWLKRNKRVEDDIDPDTEFELDEEVRVWIELESGLPLYAERRSRVRILDDERVESVAFTRPGVELPPFVLESWEPPADEESEEAEEGDASAGDGR